MVFLNNYIGYVAHLTHTVIVPGSDVNNPIVDDLFAAAHFATEAVVRLMKPGNTNWMVTDAVNKVAKDFGVVAVEGFISGQIQRNTLEANKQIHLNPRPEDRSKADNACTFEVGEAYSVEILLSSGEGKSKTVESRTTIFRRDPEVKYSLKMAASRAVFSEIQTKFGDFGFSLEQLSDPVKAKLGITECVNHNILVSYPILVEKADALVVGVTFTVLLMANGLTRLTSMPVDFSKSLKSVKDEEILELLKTSVKPKKKNAKKAKDVVKEEVATAEI